MTWTTRSPSLLLCLLALPIPALGQSDKELQLEERVRRLEERLAGSETAPVTSETGSGGLLNLVRTGLAGVEVYGFVDASYTYNVARPPIRRRANLLRVSDLDHNSISVPFAKLGVRRSLGGDDDWDAGFRVEIGAGSMVADVFSLDPEFLQGEAVNVPQAYLELRLPTPLNPVLVQAGRTYGWFGVESLDLPENPNFSLSYFANFTPYTNTGVSVGMDLGAGFRYTQWVVNGWDFVVDNNDAKSYGGQLVWAQEPLGLWAAANWLVGAERDDNEHDLRWLLELDLIWRPADSTDLRLALHYGQEEGAGVSGGIAKYGGVMVIARQGFLTVEEGTPEAFDRMAVALRAAYWRDQGGSKTGLDQALFETTATLEIKVLRFAAIRLEYRRDNSTKDYFLGRRGNATRKAMDTVSVDLSLTF